MSEEEAIKEIENYLDYEGSVSIQAIATLYTAYNKEQEKNKNSISKDKIKGKLEQIYEEYNNILADGTISLQDKNICAFQHGAMRTVLEELLKGE